MVARALAAPDGGGVEGGIGPRHCEATGALDLLHGGVGFWVEGLGLKVQGFGGFGKIEGLAIKGPYNADATNKDPSWCPSFSNTTNLIPRETPVDKGTFQEITRSSLQEQGMPAIRKTPQNLVNPEQV